jgi:multiple sugar transport system permease protein
MSNYPAYSSRRHWSFWPLFIWLCLALGSIVMLIPFLWTLSTSLKAPGQIFTLPIVWLPNPPIWENYREVVRIMPFGRFYANSLFVAVSATLLELLMASLAAFAFARLRFWGRDQLFVIYLATLMIPGQVTLVPSFVIIRMLGWYDTYQALIIPGAFSAFGTFLLRQHFRTIPVDFDEAAQLDGASPLWIWWRVVLPLSGPTLATFAIFSFLGQWNSFLWPLIVTSSLEMRTLPLGLSMLQSQYSVQWHLLMAGTMIALAPLLLLYIVGQRWIIQGLASPASGRRL